MTVYSVEGVTSSGMECFWFVNKEQAQACYDKFQLKLEQDFAAWECGEPGHDGIVSSSLESDGFGGCYYSYHVSPHLLPRMEEHAAGSLKGDRPDGIPVKGWGNPVLQRGAKPPAQA